MAEEIVNRVAASGLVSFDLEEYYPLGERMAYDLKDNLYMGLMLREKDFREFLKAYDWSAYKGKHVAIHCSADAIVPVWAYMLLSLKLSAVAETVIFGTLADLDRKLFEASLAKIDFEKFRDARVVVKGCSKVEVPTAAYVEVSNRLRPLVKSLMFGEPCSTVPLYKQIK